MSRVLHNAQHLLNSSRLLTKFGIVWFIYRSQTTKIMDRTFMSFVLQGQASWRTLEASGSMHVKDCLQALKNQS